MLALECYSRSALVLVLSCSRARAREFPCSCSSALVFVLSCSRARALVLSCSCSSARVLEYPSARVMFVLECSYSFSCSCFLCRTVQSAQVFIFRRFAFCSVCCCKIAINRQSRPCLFNSKPCIYFAQLQDLLAHRSMSTSTSASKSADPQQQQQHQQLQWVLCSSLCCMFPPA